MSKQAIKKRLKEIKKEVGELIKLYKWREL
jgi:hypothetical protein